MFDPTDSMHSDPEQLKRQKSATKLNVSSIDKATNSGVINDYAVSLEQCKCQDYTRKQQPCKHMYRLVHELGLFKLTGAVINDPSQKGSVGNSIEREELKVIIKNLNYESQFMLYGILEKSAVFIANSEENLKVVNSLVDEVLVNIENITFEDLASFYNIESLTRLVTGNPIKISRRAAAIQKMLTEYPDQSNMQLDKFASKRIKLTFNPQFEQARVSLRRFLSALLCLGENSDFYWKYEHDLEQDL